MEFRHAERLLAALLLTSPLAAPARQGGAEDAPVELDTVVVEGTPVPSQVGPLPGLALGRDQVPGNLQSATAEDLRAAHALTLADFMNRQFQGVSINDYQGNPFQMDVNFRGFTASPQIGTPQGLSTYFDGIRVNEPFGDVVNWDLLPMNAIERLDLFPGTNPLFGLNTLGGAISLRSKSGFTAPGLQVDASAGSWGRREAQLSAGGASGDWAGFAALNAYEDDGWRDNSPSELRQGFGRLDYRFGPGSQVSLSALLADNELIGNGLIPYELWEQNPESVFSSPDRTDNRLRQFSLALSHELSQTLIATAQVYRRDSRRRGLNGDIYEGFQEMYGSEDYDRRPVDTGLPVCQYADVDGDGIPDVGDDGVAHPLNDPYFNDLCSNLRFAGPARNGAYGTDPDTGEYGVAAGWEQGTPIGVLTRTDLRQVTNGLALQLSWNLQRHRFMLGASLDDSDADYEGTQQLALIDASHEVYAAPESIDATYRAAQSPVPVNDFGGSSRTYSAFAHDTWSPRDNLHLSVSARFNWTEVDNHLNARIGSDLHEIRNVVPTYILCPTTDPASCPDEPAPIRENDLSGELYAPTQERFIYRSFNPSIGVNYLPLPTVNLFASLSRGTRVPSVIELGCAFDGTLVDLNAGRSDANGNPLPPDYVARSLTGPTCTLPTTLSGDPYLPQIKAVSGEIGARGLWSGWSWNASLYRTDLRDDIYYVGSSPERSYFDTIGKTRRQGLELGLERSMGRADLRMAYSLTDATFQSEFYVLSPHNSSADFDQNSQPGSVLPSSTAEANGGLGTYHDILVEPGAQMPGVPLHNFNARFGYRFTDRIDAGLSVVAHSEAYLRGNENNAHQSGGTDAETLQWVCTGTPCVLQPDPGRDAWTGGRPFRQEGVVPGYAVFNFDWSWKLGSGLALFGQVTNLFDRDYFTAGRLGVNPYAPSQNGAIGVSGWNYNSREWQNTSLVAPAAPRGYFVGVSYDFTPS